MKATLFQQIIYGIVLFLSGCALPFADLQTAQNIGKGNVEVTPLFSNYLVINEVYSNTIGVNIDVGLNDEIDLRTSYLLYNYYDEIHPEQNHILSVSPKFALKKDKLALSLPLGISFTDSDIGILVLEPTMMMSKQLSDSVEITFNPKLLLTANPGSLFLGESDAIGIPGVGVNFGYALKIKNLPLTLRCEAGVAAFILSLKNPFLHLSLGLSYKFNKK